MVLLTALSGLACGSTQGAGLDTFDLPDGGPDAHVGPDGVPDERARADMRNDCFEIGGKGLGENVTDATGDGPIARYGQHGQNVGWTPIVGTSDDSSGSGWLGNTAWTAPSNREPNTACRQLMSIFSVHGNGGQGADAIYYATSLVHHVTDLTMPPTLAAAPPLDVPITPKIRTELHVDYERPFVRDDGTVNHDLRVVRPGDAQSWELETTCATPFTVTPRMETREAPPSGGGAFCTSSGNSEECLTYRFDYVGDHCDFVARNAVIRLPDGSSVRGAFAGHFDRAPSGASGYRVTVTNVEIER